MLMRIATRLARGTDPRLLAKFVYNFGCKSMLAVGRHKRRLRRGENFPAFLFISVTDNCNLSCQGCWVTHSDPPRRIEPEMLARILSEARAQGDHFFGILGGEPLLYEGLFDVLADFPDCYFQVFTNGTLITDEVAETMRRLGNVTPLVSIEGLEDVSDERRGGEGVYARAMAGVDTCLRHRLITGVATSICKSNLGELATESFVRSLVDRGVDYLWYYIFRPVGPNPSPELALSAAEIRDLRRFIVEMRTESPIIIVDTYWDHEGRALCPAAVGISHHIGPGGDIEPCPPIQFAADRVGNVVGLVDTFNRSRFLGGFRRLAVDTTPGCMLLDDPAGLCEFVKTSGAKDSSGRGTGVDELSCMTPLPSHHQPGEEIPEKSWFYRFAKKHWFFGFGAYG